MPMKRKVFVWIAVAVITMAALVGVLLWQSGEPSATSGDNPASGSAVHDLPVPPAVAAARAALAKKL